MYFDFDEDQRLLQQTVRDFLSGEHEPEQVRALWETPTGRSQSFWQKLAEIGVPGLLVPEADGGLGMDERDLVLVLEEAGRAALAEPVISTAAVAVPLLVELEATGTPEPARRWLGPIVRGEAIVAGGHAENPFVGDAHVAQLLLLESGDEVHALDPEAVQLTPEHSNDGSQRLFSVAWKPSQETRLAGGELGRRLQAAAFDRGALACAAEQLGVTQQLIEMAVAYASERKQFGVAIGTFQAVKHRLANAKVKLEYARSLVYRAADSVATAAETRATDVSAAKISACEAATFAAKQALQVHGAIGYTFEQDLHIWMKRAWSLDLAFGTPTRHRARLAQAVIDETIPARSFGYEPSGAPGA